MGSARGIQSADGEGVTAHDVGGAVTHSTCLLVFTLLGGCGFVHASLLQAPLLKAAGLRRLSELLAAPR
jgi:hypothetical protein